jgi:acyl carrier protein
MSATDADLQAELASIVQEVADVPAADVLPDKALRADLGLDSLAMVEVVVATEEKFDVRIPDEDVPTLRTVGDYVAYVQRVRAT